MNFSSPYQHNSRSSTSPSIAYRIAAAVIGAPAVVAGSIRREWNLSTCAPSVLVPSGNNSTGTGSLSRSVICSATVIALAKLDRSRKIVLPERAAFPKNGQPSISILATKKHGIVALIMMMSR